MTARIIDGKVIAASLREEVAKEAARLTTDHGLTPGLAVVLVGSDPASEVYVRSKGKQTRAAGMNSFEHVLPADSSESDVLAVVNKLNADASVHGILVQLPLPKHLDPQRIVAAIDPDASLLTFADGTTYVLPGAFNYAAVEPGMVAHVIIDEAACA